MHSTIDARESIAKFSFNNGWKFFSVAVCKKLRVSPNQLWVSHDGKVGALIATKGERWEEIALSQVGLDYLETALKEHRIENAIVVLAGWCDGVQTVIAEKQLGEVLASLSDVPPRYGQFGPYFWMNSDFTPFVDRELF